MSGIVNSLSIRNFNTTDVTKALSNAEENNLTINNIIYNPNDSEHAFIVIASGDPSDTQMTFLAKLNVENPFTNTDVYDVTLKIQSTGNPDITVTQTVTNQYQYTFKHTATGLTSNTRYTYTFSYSDGGNNFSLTGQTKTLNTDATKLNLITSSCQNPVHAGDITYSHMLDEINEKHGTEHEIDAFCQLGDFTYESLFGEAQGKNDITGQNYNGNFKYMPSVQDTSILGQNIINLYKMNQNTGENTYDGEYIKFVDDNVEPVGKNTALLPQAEEYYLATITDNSPNNYRATTEEQYYELYKEVYNKYPALVQLLRKVPMYALNDDHTVANGYIGTYRDRYRDTSDGLTFFMNETELSDDFPTTEFNQRRADGLNQHLRFLPVSNRENSNDLEVTTTQLAGNTFSLYHQISLSNMAIALLDNRNNAVDYNMSTVIDFADFVNLTVPPEDPYFGDNPATYPPAGGPINPSYTGDTYKEVLFKSVYGDDITTTLKTTEELKAHVLDLFTNNPVEKQIVIYKVNLLLGLFKAKVVEQNAEGSTRNRFGDQLSLTDDTGKFNQFVSNNSEKKLVIMNSNTLNKFFYLNDASVSSILMWAFVPASITNGAGPGDFGLTGLLLLYVNSIASELVKEGGIGNSLQKIPTESNPFIQMNLNLRVIDRVNGYTSSQNILPNICGGILTQTVVGVYNGLNGKNPPPPATETVAQQILGYIQFTYLNDLTATDYKYVTKIINYILDSNNAGTLTSAILNTINGSNPGVFFTDATLVAVYFDDSITDDRFEIDITPTGAETDDILALTQTSDLYWNSVIKFGINNLYPRGKDNPGNASTKEVKRLKEVLDGTNYVCCTGDIHAFRVFENKDSVDDVPFFKEIVTSSASAYNEVQDLINFKGIIFYDQIIGLYNTFEIGLRTVIEGLLYVQTTFALQAHTLVSSFNTENYYRLQYNTKYMDDYSNGYVSCTINPNTDNVSLNKLQAYQSEIPYLPIEYRRGTIVRNQFTV